MSLSSNANSPERPVSAFLPPTAPYDTDTTLLEATQMLALSQDLTKLLFNAVEGVRRIGFERVRLYTVSADKRFMVAMAQSGMTVDFVGRQFEIKGNPILENLDKCPPLFIKNRVKGKPEPHEEALDKKDVAQFLYIPLVWGQEVVGLIVADNKYSGKKIEEANLESLPLFSAQVTAALRNYFEREWRISAEWKAKKYTAINEVFSAISSKTSLQEIFDLTCRAAHDLFQVDHVGMVRFTNGFVDGYVISEYPPLGFQGKPLPEDAVAFEEDKLSDQQPTIIENVPYMEGYDSLRALWLEHNIWSLLIVPVVVDGVVVGSFSLDVIARKRPFKPEEVELGKIFAAQLGIAMKNSQLLAEATERSRQLASLSQTTLALTSRNDQDTLLSEIVALAVDLLQGRSGGIKRYYPERGYLEVITVYGRNSSPLLGEKIPIGVGMAGKMIEEDLPYLSVPNYNDWTDLATDNPAAARLESMLMAAMKWQNQTIGMIYVEDEFAHPFTEKEAKKLKLFADQAAVAFQTFELANHNSAKAEKLRWLTYAVNKTIQSTENQPLEKRLRLLTEYAVDILDSEACGISIVDKEQSALIFEAGHGYQSNAILRQMAFPIKSGIGVGLTGHIATTGKIFNQHGEGLTDHFAVKGKLRPQTNSGKCYSLLAIPLKRVTETGNELIGLLRVENKKDGHGAVDPYGCFSKEDELLLQLLADAVGAVISAGKFVSALQEKQRHYEQLIDASPAGIIFNNDDGIVEHINQKACEILGVDRSDIEEKHVQELFYEPDEVSKINRLVADSEHNLLDEYRTFLKGQQNVTIPIKLTATRLYEGDQRVKGTIGYFEDLTVIRDTRSRTDLLLMATRTLTKTPKLSAGLDEFAKMMVASWNAAFCRICLLNGNDKLIVKAIQTHPKWIGPQTKQFLNTETAVSTWPGLMTVIDKKPYHLMRHDNTKQAAALNQYGDRLQYGGLHSLLVIPLKTRNHHCVGIMLLGTLLTMPEPDFDNEQIKLARAVANQTAVLIERAHLSKEYQRRATLLAYLDDGLKTIRVTKERKLLLYEASRLAAGLSKRQIGGLLKNLPYKGELTVEAVYGLDDDLVGKTVSHSEGLFEQLVQTGQLQSTNIYSQQPNQEKIFQGQGLETLVLVPLKKINGELEAVLFVADKQKPHHVDDIDLEILERFTEQVAIALQTADLIDKETKHLSHITLLHDISNQIQMEKNVAVALNLVLTGITANYGLGFNRAAIYLLDTASKQLEGRAAIGHRRKKKNQAAWDQFDREGPHDLKSYREQIKANGLDVMPLGYDLMTDKLTIDPDNGDKFSKAFNQKTWEWVNPDQFDQLPKSFRDIFAPTTPLIILPLATEECLGLLIVDKKFTQDPIVDEEIELLHTFVNTTATVLEKNNLLEQARSGEKHLNSLYKASNRLISDQKPDKVAHSIVKLAREATTAVSVRIILIKGLDHTTQRTYLSSSSRKYKIQNPVRPDGLSMEIMRTGKAQIIPDTVAEKERISPHFFEHGIYAAAGFPISIESNRIGVMWFYYNKVYHFLDTKIQALRFYVNQSALAYENARHINNLETMRKATQALSSVHALQDVKAHILTQAKNVLRADNVAIWIYNEAREQFIISESEATFERQEWIHFQKDEPSPNGTAHTVIKKGWVGIHDVSNRQKHAYLGTKTRQHLQRVGVRSFQGVCLHDDVETLGVLYANYKTQRAFTDEDIQTARTFAHHASLALKKARLLDLQSKAQRTANIVAKLTTLKGNLTGLDNTLDMVAEGTIEALDCDAVVIYVYEQARRRLHPPKAKGVRNFAGIIQQPEVPRYSLVRQMLKRTENYLVDDVETDFHFRKSRFSDEEGIKSLAVVPLRIGEEGREKVGVIFVNYRTLHRFTQTDIDILNLFADQAAVAIYNAQLYEQVQKQNQIVHSMNKALQAISTSENLNEIFNTISKQAVRVTGAIGPEARYAHLVLVKEGNLSLNGIYPLEKLDKHKKRVDSINIYTTEKIGITGRAILQKAPILVENSTQHPDYLLLHSETQSELAVPIMDGDNVIGAINVEHPERNAFDLQDIMALQVLAKHAYVAIQKAEARETEKRHLSALSAIDNAVKMMNQTFDLNEILHTIVEQAMLLTGLDDDKAVITYIALVRGNYVNFEATFPKKDLQKIQKQLGKISLDKSGGHRMGIVGRTVVTKKVQLVPDVRKDADYLLYSKKTRSELSVPILDKGEAIGAIIIDHPQVGKFNDGDKRALSILAEHAAVAIRNGRLYRDMESVAEISHDAATSLMRTPLIHQICQRLDALWPEQVITSIRLYDPEAKVLRFVSDWYRPYSDLIDEQLKQDEYVQRLDQGICGLVAQTKRPYFTPNVTKTTDVPNPLMLIPSTRSEICVPILHGVQQELVGVIDIQSPEINLFNEHDQRSLERLAQQLAVAIRKAQDYEELQETKGLVGARTALAWMGMASNAWRHSIEGDAVTIHGLAELIEEDLSELPAHIFEQTGTLDKLNRIALSAQRILDKPITPPLSSEEGAKNILINDLIQERTYQILENEQYTGVDLYLHPSPEKITVFASSEWIRLALDMLVENAIEAMQTTEKCEITIFTEQVDQKVFIRIQDSGTGISDEMLAKMFTEKHQSKKEGHLGRGLLIVQAIAQTYGGDIKVGQTSPEGTTMLLSLPIVKP